jgi:hypothetical protein
VSFDIKVDGETVHTVDIDPRLVTGARLHSAAGEAGVAAAPFSGVGNDWINLTLDIQQPTALPVVEDDARLALETPDEVLVHNPVAVQVEEDAGKTAEGTEAEKTEKTEEPAPEPAPKVAKVSSK